MRRRTQWAIAGALATGLLLSQLANGHAEETDVHYVALGDSITAARYVPSGGFVPVYAGYLESDLGAAVTTTNLGVGGWTSGDLLDALRSNQVFRDEVTAADVITVYVGMNDFLHPSLQYLNETCGGDDNQDCLRSSVTAFSQGLPEVLDEIGALNGNPDLIMRLADVYYPTPGNPTEHPAYATLMPYLEQINGVIHDEGASRDIPVAAVFDAFNGSDGRDDPNARGMLLEDSVHPSDAGFVAIAAALRGTGYAPLIADIATGDSDCSGAVSAADAALILQASAAIIDAPPCADAADANDDGAVTAVDSTVVLQYVASLVTSLPPE